MKQHRSAKRKISSAFSGFALAASVLTASTLAGQTAASAAPLSQETSSVQPVSVYTGFTNWQNSTPQEGWTVTDEGNSGARWGFSDTTLLGPKGSEGTFAGVFSSGTRFGDSTHGTDLSLVSPAVDLTGQDSPTVEFDNFSAYSPSIEANKSVELSLDGGQTWSTAWQAEPRTVDQHVTLPIPQAAGDSDVLVRFHFTGTAGYLGNWRIDNVFIGTK
jgi:hypothetical protein